MNRPNDARMDNALKKGDVLYRGNDQYVITGNCIGFGGSCLIYPARRVGDMQNLVLKECFPYESRSESMQGLSLFMRGPSFVRRNGIVCPTNEAAQIRLENCRRMMEQEKEIGQIISNSTRRVIRFDRILKPDAVMHDGTKYNNVSGGLFAVLEQMKNAEGSGRSKQKGTFAHELLPAFWETEGADYHGFSKLYLLACLIEQTLNALESVHNAGYLHGDIQEGNVLFEDCNLENGELGIGCLIDFGCSQKLKNGYTDELRVDSIFTTAGYIPPEIDYCDSDRIRLTIAADIYSVGRLMCRFLFQETSEEDWANGKPYGTGLSATALRRQAWINGDRQLAEIVSQILQIATRLNPEERYQSASEMREDIRKLMDLTAPPKFVLSPGLSPGADFVPGSRDKELREIDRMLQEDGRVFLWGVGGIGKTETAVQYAKSHKGIKGAYLVHYKGTMLDTVNSIRLNKSGTDSGDPQKKFAKRMEILKRQCRGALFIVDDFYVRSKSIQKLMAEKAFVDFCSSGIKCIFITEYSLEDANLNGAGSLEITRLAESHLLALMQRYCKGRNYSEAELLELIRSVNGHTLTVTLLAKTAAQAFCNSEKPAGILAALQSERRNQETRSNRKEDIYTDLRALLRTTPLSMESKVLLRYASFVPDGGMSLDIFRKSAEASQDVRMRLGCDLDRLIKMGWLNRERREDDSEVLKIHPVVRRACTAELMPTASAFSALRKNMPTPERNMLRNRVRKAQVHDYRAHIKDWDIWEFEEFDDFLDDSITEGTGQVKACRFDEALQTANDCLYLLDEFEALKPDDHYSSNSNHCLTYHCGGSIDYDLLYYRVKFLSIKAVAGEKLGCLAECIDWAEQAMAAMKEYDELYCDDSPWEFGDEVARILNNAASLPPCGDVDVVRPSCDDDFFEF